MDILIGYFNLEKTTLKSHILPRRHRIYNVFCSGIFDRRGRKGEGRGGIEGGKFHVVRRAAIGRGDERDGGRRNRMGGEKIAMKTVREKIKIEIKIVKISPL